MNSDLERTWKKASWPNPGTIQAFAWKDHGNHKIPVWIADSLTAIRTKPLRRGRI
jgi:hypothetical protein